MKRHINRRKRYLLLWSLLLVCLFLQTACGETTGLPPAAAAPPDGATVEGTMLGEASAAVGTAKESEVVITEETEELVLPHTVTYTYSTDYTVGERVTLSEGEDGAMTRTYLAVRVDGVVAARTAIKDTVTKESRPQVICIGTRELPPTTPTGTFAWPTVNHRITSYYGRRWLSGQYDFHYGIDIAGGIGAKVFATDGGTVIFAGKATGTNWSYGNLVIIDHGNGYTSYYAHLSGIMVSAGDAVYQGQAIGLVGATGNVTGPHLHFEIRKNGLTQNPLKFVSP